MSIKGKLSDEWITPTWLYDYLNERFSFVVDVCATKENSKCPFFIKNALSEEMSWAALAASSKQLDDFEESFIKTSTGSYFMNPPYSQVAPFIRRAWEESKKHQIVCLLKTDPSTKWWGIFWDFESQQPKAGCRIENPFYEGRNQGRRVKFDPPSLPVLQDYLENGTEKDKKLAKNLLKGKVTTPAFASAIVIFDRRYLNN